LAADIVELARRHGRLGLAEARIVIESWRRIIGLQAAGP
jgi:hypothetical protein